MKLSHVIFTTTKRNDDLETCNYNTATCMNKNFTYQGKTITCSVESTKMALDYKNDSIVTRKYQPAASKTVAMLPNALVGTIKF